MAVKTLRMPEDAIVNMLKALPKSDIIDIFYRTVVESDVSPLTRHEREDIRKSRKEFEKGTTVKWADLK
ncbi:MAG: hypothetical protein GXP46_08120 [Deferribacteres bacterium]|nr:hypothetical protein [Deferribacteres bacterium]